MSKRILSLVLALVMVLGAFGTVFADTAAALDPKVQWLIDQGLLQGDGSGNYDLDKTVTRDVLARIVAVALQDEESAKSLQALPSGFADMTPGNWANGYASYANAKGYMIGNAKREFMPKGTVTYAEALVVLTKIALNGDLTAAEKANALTWYAPYVAKANEIGVTEGVAIANVGAQAVKEDILKMLYNVLNNKNFGNYNVIKAIVLENDRIARVGANEVTVEVIKEVQRANFVEETRKDLKGEQYTYELPAKFNAEDLLGKVVDLSIDKNNKVVEVKVDTTYEVLTGAISSITPSRLTINNKQYIVNLDERYNKEDERVYRTYLNDKDLKYSDFAKDHEDVEYARVTVKAGKVLFVDAYDFNDIMPVKEVKEVRGKNTILSYDDVRNNNLIETEVKATRVILVNGKTFTRGTLEDVKADNVIHTYKVGSSTKYMVLQDKAIQGKLEKITEDKDGYYVVVAGEEYTIPETSPKEAVYEFSTDGKFYTLSAKTAYKELDTFRGEEVKVLLALNEEVQYVGSDVGFGEFVGVATRVIGKEMRVLNPENKTNDYSGNLDTTVYIKDSKSSTAHKGLNAIKDNSLVYINADSETLVTVRDYNDPVKVTKLTTKDINGYRITDDTVVFVVNSKGRVEVRKISDVVKAYDKLKEEDVKNVEVSLIDEVQFDKISVRGYKYARADHAHTIVLYNLNIEPAKKDAVYGKLIRYTDRQASGRSTILVELADGKERTFTLDSKVNEDAINFVKGNIYEIVESKETEDLALFVEKVKFEYKEVEEIRNYVYSFKNSDVELYETRNTDIFGRRPRVGDKISYLADANKDMLVIVNPGFATEEVKDAAGIVTYINTAGTAFAVDGEIYSTNKDTVVKDAAGKVIGLGDASVLVEGDVVDVKDNVITRKVSVVAEAAAVDALIEAFSTPATKAEVTAAKAAYDKLNDYGKALVKPANVIALTNAENTLAAAAVDTLIEAFSTPATKAEVTAARAAYDALNNTAKALVKPANVTALTDAEAALAGAAVQELINALPAKADVKLADKAQVVAVRTAYNKLTPAQATGLVLTKLTDAEAVIIEWEKVAKAKADLVIPVTGTDVAPEISQTIANHANGATYTVSNPANLVGNTGTTPGAATSANPIVITRDSDKVFTFEITVTIANGTVATEDVVFVVTVPNTLEAVTIAVK